MSGFRACLLVSLWLSALPAAAAVFTVTSTADGGAGSLRAALDAAVAAPSGSHEVRFDPSFPLGGEIELMSMLPEIDVIALTIHGNGREPRIVGDGSFAMLRTTATLFTLRLEEVSFAGGLGAHGMLGGCLSAESVAPGAQLLIKASAFESCGVLGDGWARGGAVYWSGAQATIHDSRFEGNWARSKSSQASGGVVYVVGNLLVERSDFLANSALGRAAFGGVISARNQVTVRDSAFQDNMALALATPSSSLGGAVLVDCETCSVTLERNAFIANLADVGGAVYLRGNADMNSVNLVASNNTFHGNQALDSGGGMVWVRVRALARHNTFAAGSAPDGSAAHLWVINSNVVLLANNVMASVLEGRACHGATEQTPIQDVGNYGVDESCAWISAGMEQAADMQEIGLDTTQRLPVVRFAAEGAIVDGGDVTGCLDEDIHGAERPIDGDGDGSAHCDVGAFEHPYDDTLFADGFEDGT